MGPDARATEAEDRALPPSHTPNAADANAAKFNTESTPNEYRIDNGEVRHGINHEDDRDLPASVGAGEVRADQVLHQVVQFCARNMAYQDKRGHVSMRPDMGGRMSTARHVVAFLQGGLAA